MLIQLFFAPRVAVSVLHRTGYRRCALDLKDYILEGSFPGRDRANLQVVQPAPPIYQDPHFGGLTNGPHVDQAPNPVSNSETNFDQLWIHTSSSLDEPFVPENNLMPEGSVQGNDQANLQVLQPGPPIYQDPYFGGLTDGPHVDQTTIPVSNSESNFDQPWIYSSAYLDEPFGPLLFSENSMPEPSGEHSYPDEMLAQDYCYDSYGELSVWNMPYE